MSLTSTEHPFAEFIKILGKGKKGSRDLTQDEAYRAMQMILSDQVQPIQLGAFLMLMRIKEETREELAGFVQAVREHLPQSSLPGAKSTKMGVLGVLSVNLDCEPQIGHVDWRTVGDGNEIGYDGGRERCP